MARIGTNAARDFEPVQMREPHIQDDDIGRHLVDERQRGTAVRAL